MQEIAPPPPRPLTPTARRRSWAEMPVRIWLILSIAVALVIVYFTITQLIAASAERTLIQHGTTVRALVFKINGTTNANLTFPRRDPLGVWLKYTPPGESGVQEFSGYLSRVDTPTDATPDTIRPGTEISIKVDPSDAGHWTDRSEPTSLLVELAIALMLLPVLLVLLLVALLKRMQILRTWQHGDAAEAVVVEIRQTAIAPASRLLRLTLNDHPDRRVFGVLLPSSAGVPVMGDTVQIVMPRGVPARAVLAKLYL